MMEQEIMNFQKQNGNVKYTVKELIGALHTKTDKILDKLETKASKRMVVSMYGTLFTLLGALAYCVFFGGV